MARGKRRRRRRRRLGIVEWLFAERNAGTLFPLLFRILGRTRMRPRDENNFSPRRSRLFADRDRLWEPTQNASGTRVRQYTLAFLLAVDVTTFAETQEMYDRAHTRWETENRDLLVSNEHPTHFPSVQEFRRTADEWILPREEIRLARLVLFHAMFVVCHGKLCFTITCSVSSSNGN